MPEGTMSTAAMRALQLAAPAAAREDLQLIVSGRDRDLDVFADQHRIPTSVLVRLQRQLIALWAAHEHGRTAQAPAAHTRRVAGGGCRPRRRSRQHWRSGPRPRHDSAAADADGDPPAAAVLEGRR
jgi:hypothetical protein